MRPLHLPTLPQVSSEARLFPVVIAACSWLQRGLLGSIAPQNYTRKADLIDQLLVCRLLLNGRPEPSLW